jgi:outer membrane lipoprotein SlyB
MKMAEKKLVAGRFATIVGTVFLGACTVLPTGPSVMVLPGSGYSIENFREDDMYCRQYAHIQIGGKTAEDAGRESAVTSAVVGAAIGAVAGAALGGNRGAAAGAGVGLLVGSASGAEAARSSTIGTQRQYDNAYVQCMYSKGHRVPVSGNMATPRAVARTPEANIPPPPPGAPPPPPPGVK